MGRRKDDRRMWGGMEREETGVGEIDSPWNLLGMKWVHDLSWVLP